MKALSPVWKAKPDEMWAILSPGSEHVVSSEQHFLPPARKAGMLQHFDKSRSRSLPPGRQDPAGALSQVQPTVGFEGERGDQAQLVPVRKESGLAGSLHAHVLHLEERLERGAQEVHELRLRNEHACREAASAKSHLHHVQHQVHELQTRNAAREQDSMSLAALRQALHMHQQHLSAELASTDVKGHLTAQEGRNATSNLQGLVQQLQSSLSTEKVTTDQAHKCLSTDVHSLQLAVANDSATIATLRQSDAEVHSNLTTVQSQLQHEQALRMEDRSTIRQELTHLKQIADSQIRIAKEEAINRIEEKTRALQSMHEQVTSDLVRVDQQNKRELQISDQLLASMQANDKEAFLSRFMSVERTLKEAISQQLSAESSLDAKIAAHNTQVSQMISQVDSRTKRGETVLRDQVESAMSRLRTYARDVEEHMGQASTRLEGVVKVEIQARKESNRQLRAESLQQVEQTNASVHKVDKKIEVVLGAQRMLHSHHEALQIDHDMYKQDTSARIDKLSAHVTHEVEACRDKLEREVSAVQGDVAAKCKAAESMCQESVQDLQEDTQAKLNQMWDALTKRNDEMETRSHGTRAEVFTAISSSMELIKGLGDTVERIELTDMAEVTKHMETLAQTMEEEQTVVRQLLEDNAQEARTELQETESDIQTAMDGVWETVKQNSSQYEGLQTRHDKLREDLLMLLTTEADNRQNSIAVVQNSFTTGLNQQQADLKALSESTEEVAGNLQDTLGGTNESLKDAKAAHTCLAEEVQTLQQLITDNKSSHDAGLSAAVQTCTERIEAEVAKLQVDVDLRATEEGASELRRSIVLITEQLQALTSQEEQGMQDLNSKLAAQTTSTEELRAAHEELATTQAATADLVNSEVSRLQTTIESNAVSSQDNNTGLEELQLALQLLQAGKADVEALEAVKAELTAAQGIISTLAAQETAETLQGEVQGLKTLCEELGSTKASLTDLQAASKALEELQESSNARITELQDKAGALQSDMLDHTKQLADHAASTSAIQEDVATKASRDDAEKLQGDLQHLQQQAETFATMHQVETMSQDMQQVQQGLNEAVVRMEGDVKAASEGKSSTSAELTAALDTQQKQQAAAEDRISSISETLQQLQSSIDSCKTESEQTVEKMCDVIKEIEKTYASASQLEELRKMVDGKADSSTLDNVAGGSSQAMEDVESKIKQLEQLYSEQAADVKAANDALLNKVDAGDVAALSSAMREQQSSSVPSASITQLQEALDSAVAQLEGQKQQLESIQETTENKTIASEQQHKQFSEDVAKALQVAEAAASSTSLAALSDTVAKLEAGMPSKEELAKVQGQLATLQNGMAALDDLSNMRTELESLRVRMEKVDQLRNDIEGVKTDILTNEQGVNELQEQAVANEKASRQLQEDVTRLNTSVEKLLDATAQVEKLEIDVKQLSDQLTPLQALGVQVEAVEQQIAAAADRKTVSELQERLDAVNGKLAGMQAVAREEAEAVMELLRGNMQTQIDSVKEKGSSVDEEQDTKLRELEERMKTTLETDINKEQDRKLSELDHRIRKVIHQVASAPVEVNLSDEAKRAIIADLERRVTLIEANVGGG